jgi:hypothetical protein
MPPLLLSSHRPARPTRLGPPSRGARAALAALAALALHPGRADAAPDDAAALLSRAKDALGFAAAGTQVIHVRAVIAIEQAYQSDRSYPPFFSAMGTEETWFATASGVERTSRAVTYPGSTSPPEIALTDARRAFAVGKDGPRIASAERLDERYLNPWAVIADWAAAGDARIAGRTTYRDYPRVVLVRTTPAGEQRLFLDPKTGFPVKLERTARHYLWGQRSVEHVYSNWLRAHGLAVAGSSFLLADGHPEVSRTVGDVELVAPAAAPSLAIPAAPDRSPDDLPRFLQPLDVTTTAVGPHTYLLSNPGYTIAVAQIGDEVFVFDATQGEERARKDAAAIAALFPGAHKTTVVVTDLAWPHIAGIRYWAASGATIVTHDAGRAFLQRVLDRRWTLAPDVLEQRRATVVPHLVGVTALTRLAGGAVTLHPIDGIGSEGALMAYVPGDRFLWASDYLQTLAEPSLYAEEVVAAVRRDRLAPDRVAAQHLPLTPWSKVIAIRGS